MNVPSSSFKSLAHCFNLSEFLFLHPTGLRGNETFEIEWFRIYGELASDSRTATELKLMLGSHFFFSWN